MKLDERRLYGTTDTSGDLTVNDEGGVFGVLYAVAWIDGTLADNNTAVISTQNHEAAATLLTLGAGEGDDDLPYYPRALVHDQTGGVLTGTAGGDRVMAIAAGTLRLVVVDGGATKEGGCIVYIDTDV